MRAACCSYSSLESGLCLILEGMLMFWGGQCHGFGCLSPLVSIVWELFGPSMVHLFVFSFPDLLKLPSLRVVGPFVGS